MKYPKIWTLNALIKHSAEVSCSTDGKTYVPCRPNGYPSITVRFKAAWAVFTGKADVVIWPIGQ